MIQVVIIGYGNVGSHLAKAFQAADGVEVIQVYSRKKQAKSAESNFFFTQHLSDLKKADVYIVAVPDDAIAEVTVQLPGKNLFVVHTSGGAHMDVINEHHRRGVFYPLQSFSKSTEVDYSNIPICMEAEDEKDTALLASLGACISEKTVVVSSENRAQLHLAAVFVNNFVNHLYHISEELLAAKQLDFDLLKPLILETARKVQQLSPSDAQTGPALRKDLKTIKKHVDLLEDESLEGLYAYFTKAIHQASTQQ